MPVCIATFLLAFALWGEAQDMETIKLPKPNLKSDVSGE